MPAEKKFQIQTFSGGIDTDTADELLPSDCYRIGRNIRIFSTDGGKRGIVTNIKGNLEVAFDQPAGINITIGGVSDPENKKFYFFNWNENGYHVIYQYDSLLNQVIPVLRNLTDTNGIDILKFKKRSLILHVDIVGGNLIYWCDGQVKQKKFNIKKALDKSNAGYGQTIEADFINAYKLQPIFPAKISYFTDTTRLTNYLYGHLYKVSYRFIYDDGEKSNWSEFSTVPLPQNESFLGTAAISNVNNCLKISVETGSRIVVQIEIAIKSGADPFKSIITLDKSRLSISSDSLYVYSFYNDNTSASSLDQIKVERAYSFMPDIAKVQAFVNRALVYGGGREGFPAVNVNLSVSANYSTLFLPDATENELNDPSFTQTAIQSDYTREDSGRRRNTRPTLRIGVDVKAGNKFELFGRNGQSDNLYYTYTATNADDAVSVANNFKQQLVATGRILESSEDLPNTDIWENTTDMSGNVSFSFILRGRFNENSTTFEGRVNPISFQTLKDTGQSIGNHKSGGSVKYALTYVNENTKRSASYTTDSAFIRTDFVTETDGYKQVVHQLMIKNPPPIWATHYEITRTVDLTYGTNWIHVLIQKAIESQSTTNTEYVDLVIGSLFTYQRMYPNTVINFDFQKNDRVRLIKKETGGTFYDFLETVVLSYSDNIEEIKNEDITTDETNTVTISGTTSSDNIGRYISINGTERLIIAAPTGTTYTLDQTFGADEKFTSYTIIDRRGVIRVRKPIGVTIEDNSLIEVYKPTQNIESAQKNFFLFGQKYAIQNPGTELRSHTGNVQNQDPLNPSATPAIVNITKGMSYIRQRQLPTNNSIPGTQAINDLIEDKNYSDFYESDLNDNGKVSPEDDGSGEKVFPDRLRFSNNYIEDTRINGLNDFENLDRKDYNDRYGGFELIKYIGRNLHAYKTLRTGYIPIFATIIQGDNGEAIGLGTSNQLLNELQYFSHDGGIGKNPESWAIDQSWQWFASTNSGTFCRTGGDGILPISQQFNVDSLTKYYLKRADKYSTFILGEFDKLNNEYVPSFEVPNEYIFNGPFTEAEWERLGEEPPEETEFEITTDAAHGSVIVTMENQFLWTPDTDYIGSDFFYFRYKLPEGEWSTPRKRCLRTDDQPLPVVQTIYYNDELIVNIAKNDCNTGYHGTNVPYTVPALKYSSPYSQGNADQQAEDEVTLYGQNFANETGTCEINDPDAFSFVDRTGVPVSTMIVSNEIVVSDDYDDYNMLPVDCEASVNGGAFSDLARVVYAGDHIRIQRLSSATASTLVSAILYIGSVSDIWNITTAAGETFGNVELSDVFQRDDCEEGSSGTYVTYYIPEDTYYASTQEDADDLAQDDIDANGQLRANGNVEAGFGYTDPPDGGTCTIDDEDYFLKLEERPGSESTLKAIFATLRDGDGNLVSVSETIMFNYAYLLDTGDSGTSSITGYQYLLATTNEVLVQEYISPPQTAYNFSTNTPDPATVDDHPIITGAS